MSGFLRGDDEEVASFFAFQDVITAVLGILILIALQLSFSINVTKGEKGNKESTTGSEVITETDFLNKQKEKEVLEEKLLQLTNKNRTILNQKEVMESAGKSSLETEEHVLMLLSEIEQLELERDALEKSLKNKQKSLNKEAENLGLSSVQTEISKLIEQSRKDFNSLANLKAEENQIRSKLKSSLNDLSSQKKKIDYLWLIPEKDDDGKDALLVTVDGRNMQFEEFDKPESLRVLNTSTLTTSFKSAVRNYDENKFKIVFLFKPSGASHFEKLTNLARALGYEVGYDPIEEKQKIMFSVPD